MERRSVSKGKNSSELCQLLKIGLCSDRNLIEQARAEYQSSIKNISNENGERAILSNLVGAPGTLTNFNVADIYFLNGLVCDLFVNNDINDKFNQAFFETTTKPLINRELVTTNPLRGDFYHGKYVNSRRWFAEIVANSFKTISSTNDTYVRTNNEASEENNLRKFFSIKLFQFLPAAQKMALVNNCL